jgi:hypothetical protein
VYLRNYSRYPTDEVTALVKFAAQRLPINTMGICIDVRNTRSGPYHGRAHGSVPRRAKAPPATRWLITLHIGSQRTFPASNFWMCRKCQELHAYGGAGSPKILYGDWREAVVGVAAHELNHVRQLRNNSPRSEVNCEKAALRVLTAWRIWLWSWKGDSLRLGGCDEEPVLDIFDIRPDPDEWLKGETDDPDEPDCSYENGK